MKAGPRLDQRTGAPKAPRIDAEDKEILQKTAAVVSLVSLTMIWLTLLLGLSTRIFLCVSSIKCP